MAGERRGSGGEATRGAPPCPVIDREVCKGCGRCVSACPRGVLRLSATLNHQGVRPAEYAGAGCTGCAVCFYNCPEIYALAVHLPRKDADAAAVPGGGAAARSGHG